MIADFRTWAINPADSAYPNDSADPTDAAEEPRLRFS